MQRSNSKAKTWQSPLLLASVIAGSIASLSGLIYYFEAGAKDSIIKTFWDAVWWAVVTMSTVGYGDMVPKTPQGKAVAVLAFFSGIVLIAVLTASIASKLVERLVIKVKPKDTSNLKNHILVLGWNENGEKIIGNIERDCDKDTEIVVMCSIDQMPNLPEGVIGVNGNFTRLEELKRVSAQNAKVVMILADTKAGMDTDSRTILTVMAVKRISNGKARCICEVFSSEDREYLENVGADEIIVRSELAGTILSRTVYNPGLGGFMQDLLKFEGTSTILMKIAIPDQIGLTFGYMFSHLYQKHNEILLGILRNGIVLTNPDSEEIIKENDKLFMLSPELACTMKGR
ncbi:MAG: NAD-binding protein [Caldisericia bacterium]|nr:NAD-binding protein [Caldisericia bacterium]